MKKKEEKTQKRKSIIDISPILSIMRSCFTKRLTKTASAAEVIKKSCSMSEADLYQRIQSFKYISIKFLNIECKF
jgi:hypothetical protein